ncbi:MAG TPA: methyltransferase domain-containing protein [Azoarcus taiwanensis]|nr:methyltransferase domain-containing protein [Azoarcus taiwanensis]
MTLQSSLWAKAHYQRREERQLVRMFETRFLGRSCLDVGCGEGRYLRMLSGLCSRMVGIDENPDQIGALRREGFEVFHSSEFIPGKYDLILVSHVVEHLSAQELVGFMEKYVPMLQEQGRLIVITPFPGIRFWHDWTHVRPYTPQSLGMLFGILGGPAAYRAKVAMELEDIWFFRDCWRIRNSRGYFSLDSSAHPIGRGFRQVVQTLNTFFACLYLVSGGRAGGLASWMGVYRQADTKGCHEK